MTDEKLDLLLEGQGALVVRMEKVEATLQALRNDMEYKFDVAFDELHIIRGALENKVDREEFSELERRVKRLERSRE